MGKKLSLSVTSSAIDKNLEIDEKLSIYKNLENKLQFKQSGKKL